MPSVETDGVTPRVIQEPVPNETDGIWEFDPPVVRCHVENLTGKLATVVFNRRTGLGYYDSEAHLLSEMSNSPDEVMYTNAHGIRIVAVRLWGGADPSRLRITGYARDAE